MMARQRPQMVLTTLSHHIDIEWLREAYRRTRKDGAVGVDGQTASEYAAKLEENLQSLLERFKSGSYRAPAVRRVYIPKGDGSKSRPIGIPSFEDKVLQRAVVMLLEAVYEQDFLDCSYGFRPGRSAHAALGALERKLTAMNGGWVLELDIQSYYDTVVKQHLRDMLEQRVRDGVVRRAIDKWLKAGVMEEGCVKHPETGVPQGGVVSPILSNVYLHYVLDKWFEQEVKPRLKGRASMIRYADDAVLLFSEEADARRVMEVLPKRFGKYGLSLNAEKTQLLDFRRTARREGAARPRGEAGARSFEFLGFVHYWGKTRRGLRSIKSKTSPSRLGRSLKRVAHLCRRIRHLKLKQQQEQLASRVTGHYAYFGISGNSDALGRFYHEVRRTWYKWLSRRSNNGTMSWDRFLRIERRYALPKPKIVHKIYWQSAARP